MKRKGFYRLLAAGGLAGMAAGLMLLRACPEGAARTAFYLMVGLGSGVFGHGAGMLLSFRAVKNAPDAARQLEIERKDERNRAIADRAKARAYDAMVFIFGAVMLSLALMEVDLAALLLVVCAYLFVVGIGCYYRVRYQREM